MQETLFHQLADQQLDALAAPLEAADDEGLLEIQYDPGIITITLDNGKQYIINKHGPSRQIWVSSPVSGAGYFSYDEGKNAWLDKNGISLEELLQSELPQM